MLSSHIWGGRIDAELLFHAEHGVEIQFLHDDAMVYGRRWTVRALSADEAVPGCPSSRTSAKDQCLWSNSACRNTAVIGRTYRRDCVGKDFA
jgi:hypothetical protein